MVQLTPEGRKAIEELAQRLGFSPAAVTGLLDRLVAGGGSQAQFDDPEFGGMGQWARGGMIMIGDMFNNALKARVDELCRELSAFLDEQRARGAATQGFAQAQSQRQGSGQSQYQGSGQYQGQGTGGGFDGVSLFVSGGGNWWPDELGQPSSSGSQNDLHYAFFPQTRRLAVKVGGKTVVYDTRDHQIGGVSQQQGGGQSLTFTSQYGLVRLADLPVVSGTTPERPQPAPAQSAPAAQPATEPAAAKPAPAQPAPAQPAPGAEPAPAKAASPAPTAPAPAGGSALPPGGADDVFAKIERLADLRTRGILSDEEFAAKKSELLSRI